MDENRTVDDRHLWLSGPSRSCRLRLLAGLDVPPLLSVVDAHRRLRGPYTAAGSLLRQIVPPALQREPRLVSRHHVEIVAAAPELAELIPASGTTTAGRYRPAGYTRRLACGLAEFLVTLQRGAGGAATVLVDNLQHADPTDVELVAVLLERVDPGVITVVAGTSTAVPDGLARLLDLYCLPVEAHDDEVEPGRQRVPARVTDADLAETFVRGDGTSDDVVLRQAYQRLPARHRAMLHDRRADELERAGEASWRLGALPWHRELGRDPSGSGAAALRFAAGHCLRMGFHDAAAELAARGRAVVDPRSRPREWWAFSTVLTAAQAALGRLPASEVRAQRARAAHLSTSSARHHLAFVDAVVAAGALDDDGDRNGVLACVVAAAALPEATAVAVLGLARDAAAELTRPDLPRAVALVDEAIAQLGPGRHTAVRAELLGVRARLLGRMRRWEDALADRTAAAGLDPTCGDHHHERAATLQRLGRHAEAVEGFGRAIALSPPCQRAHLARSDSRRELGDHDGALADVRYVLRLWPSDLEALARRAALLQVTGDHQAAVAAFDDVLSVADDPEARRGRDLSLLHLGGVDAQATVPHPRC